MPSWNIHTAHAEHLLANRDPESLGIGDSTPVDKSAKPVRKAEADPCLNDDTSKEGRKAAETGDSIKVDVETRRSVI